MGTLIIPLRLPLNLLARPVEQAHAVHSVLPFIQPTTGPLTCLPLTPRVIEPSSRSKQSLFSPGVRLQGPVLSKPRQRHHRSHRRRRSYRPHCRSYRRRRSCRPHCWCPPLPGTPCPARRGRGSAGACTAVTRTARASAGAAGAAGEQLPLSGLEGRWERAAGSAERHGCL